MWGITEPSRHRSGTKKVCVVGGGYSGVELAVGLASDGYKVTLLESGEYLLIGCHPFTEKTAREALERHGVDVRLRTQVGSWGASPRE
jgi:pyruvate/2-oxoglutarate dehydrogenase complex dihydrolipoamide dehydrogenase (E3) component